MEQDRKEGLHKCMAMKNPVGRPRELFVLEESRWRYGGEREGLSMLIEMPSRNKKKMFSK